MFKQIKNFAIASATLLPLLPLSTSAELADSKSLYDLAPEGAAFVRIVNVTDTTFSAEIDGKAVNAAATCGISEVVWVNEATALPMTDITVEADTLYTMVLSESGTTVEQRKAATDPYKAEFATFNLTTDATVDVVTTQGLRPVFKSVAPGASQSRPLNPITIGLSLMNESMQVDMQEVSLDRGAVTEAFICGNEDELTFALSSYRN